MKRLLPLLLLLTSSVTAQTIFIVRHAEKVSETVDALDNDGKERADCLAYTLQDANVQAIYVSSTDRARQTGAPLARSSNIGLTEYAPKDYAGLVAKIHAHSDQNALIVGHSNTVPDIIKALGAERPADNDDFDWLYLVTIEGKSVRLSKLHYCGAGKKAAMRHE
jgi:2,3-bisphosphoglycerate-dependent phosphoglycerate mutase